MNTKQFLSDILDEFNKIDYVKPEDIPNIDLYMDQVTTFMDEHLGQSKRYEVDKVLTKTSCPRIPWIWWVFSTPVFSLLNK